MMTTKTRNRRTPAELIAALDERLAKLCERADKVAGQRDRLKARYAKSLELAGIATLPAEQLQDMLGETKKAQKLLRLAVKAKRGAP